MKYLLLLGLFVILSSAYAQNKSNPDFYWVVETNSKDRSYSIVKLYNLENELVYEVRLEGLFVNVRNTRQRRLLDQLLRNYSERSTATVKRVRAKGSRLNEEVRNLKLTSLQS